MGARAVRPVGELIPVRRLYPCGPGGFHWVAEPAPGAVTHCPCGSVSQVRSPDRYCMPRNEHGNGTCYCGECPHYTPVPPVNYRQVVARMERERLDAERRRRETQQRLARKRSR